MLKTKLNLILLLSYRILLSLLGVFLISSCVNNDNNDQESFVPAPLYPLEIVQLNLDNTEITSDKTTFARAQGGKAPFTFSLLNGAGTVNSGTGEYTPAPSFVGTATIQVQDSTGQTASGTLTVYAPLTVNPQNTVTYINQEVTLTTAGGKPPYVLRQNAGGASLTQENSTTTHLTMSAHSDTVMITVTDSLFNIASASIIVIPPLAMSAEAQLFPTVNSDGTAKKMQLSITGGKANSAGDFILQIQHGVGNLTKVNATTYEFTADPYLNQNEANEIVISVTDDLGTVVTTHFGYFVPLKVFSGGLHSCALNEVNQAGQVKCWGEGIHGQLGQGDDTYSQPYWGDCLNCGEDSRQSTTNTDHFKQVEVLTPTEKSAGAFIYQFDVGPDLMCAVISKDATGNHRDVRCLGYNTRVDGSPASRLGIAANRFPFVNLRHGSISPTTNTKITLNPTLHSAGYLYRFAIPDNYLLADSYFSGGEFFPRTFNPLPNSGSYQITRPRNRATFGLNLSSNGAGGFYQNPALFDFFSVFDTLNWQIESVNLTEQAQSGFGYEHLVLISSPTIGGSLSQAKMGLGGLYNNSAPYVTSVVANKTAIKTGVGFKKVAFSTSTYEEPCYIGSDDLIYCTGSANDIIGVNDSSLIANANNNRNSPSYVAGNALPVTTTLGGDADLAFDISKMGGFYNFGYGDVACAIFDGNPAIGVTDNLVACWGHVPTSGIFGNGNITTSQYYAMPVKKLFDDSNLIGASKIKITTENACALIPGGAINQQLYCWGNSSATTFQLTSQYTTKQTKAVPINLGGDEVLDFDIAPNGGMCAITRNSGTKYLKCWGQSPLHSFSLPKPTPGYYAMDVTTFIVGSTNPSQVILGVSAGCMLSGDQKYLKCWGDNRSGILGIDNGQRGNKPGDMNKLPLVPLGTSRKAKQLTAGFEHTCAILDNDYAKCWGSNLYGETGQNKPIGFGISTNPGNGHIGINPDQMGDNLAPLTFAGDPDNKVSLIQSGGDHVCAVTLSNNLYCWGDNSSGQAGQTGATATTLVFTTPQKVTLPAGNIEQLALGIDHTCVLLNNSGTQNIYCWGSNLNGQLGYGDLTSLLSSSAHTNNIIGDQSTDIAVASLPPLFLNDYAIKKITAGNLNTCILFTNGKARCFGKNNFGQIGIGTFDNNNDGTNDDMGLRIADTGYKYLLDFGSNQITHQPHLVNDIYVGHDFSCALLDNGQVKCWGYNKYGQLGFEDTQNRGVNNGEMGDALPYVNLEPGQTAISLSLGVAHSCAVLSNGKVKCWGANFSGQLGFDADFGRGAYPFTMGGSLPYNKVSF